MNNNTANATAQFIAWTKAQPDSACRRWSYEIEAHDLAKVSDRLQALGFNTMADGSVNTDCSCDCGTCDHSCDCERCGFENSWDEDNHCDTCMDSEAVPTDSKPVITTHDTDRLPEAMRLLARYADLSEDCGGHIHVDATGVTAQGAGDLMRLWHKVDELLPELVGRESCNYAQLPDDYAITTARQNGTTDRYLSVNIQNWKHTQNGYSGKNTIEFRQFAGSLNADEVIARGFLCRALVEYAVNRKPLYWVLRATTGHELLKALGLGTAELPTPPAPAQSLIEEEEKL